jgi:hypothetical protein
MSSIYNKINHKLNWHQHTNCAMHGWESTCQPTLTLAAKTKFTQKLEKEADE